MAEGFWYFVIYSFLGFLLEVLFARALRIGKRDRKCLYLLPLCPVYGLGALLILSLPAAVLASPLLLFLFGGLAATAAEYSTGLFYEGVARVRFWDYSGKLLNVRGRVCLPFAALWGLLAVALVYLAHPLVAPAAAVPLYLLPPAALLLAGDSYYTLRLLRRTGDTASLRWYRQLHPLQLPQSLLHKIFR